MGVMPKQFMVRGKNDHKIINAAITLADTMTDHQVVMVTKDINLRLKSESNRIDF